jgi:hypothetical protein
LTTFLGLGAAPWLLLVDGVMTLLLLGDAFAGHYRSGFRVRAQYLPFLAGAALAASCLAAALAPGASWAPGLLRGTGWAAVASGLVGFAFHQYHGVARGPGSYLWWLYHLMYGPPCLAPRGLTVAGALALIVSRHSAAGPALPGPGLRSSVLGILALSLLGAILQSAVLHYRGAFNNPAMYAPLFAPLVTAVLAGGALLRPGFGRTWLAASLWVTFATGFVGLGMHLRGFDRQMGGLYVTVFNWLEGPPAFAPGLFATLAALGLVAVYLA